MPKENNEDQDEEAESAISEAGKDIKKGEDRYNARMKLAAEGKAPPTVILLALKNQFALG